MNWIAKHPQFKPEMLGYLDSFLNESDPQSAAKQFNSAYQHGGGWTPFEGFTMLQNGNMKYPGDPPCQLLAETKLRNETIRFYESAWIAIIQEDGSYEVCRID